MPEFVKWETAFNTGVEIIDEQHKELVNMLNELYVAQEDNKKIYLDKFLDYSNFHFGTEEKVMEYVKYPQLKNQILSHRKFIDFVETSIKNIESISLDDLFDFAVDWLVNHILREDQEFGKFIHKRNIKINFQDL